MSEVTRILSAIEQGDPQAGSQLLPLVYDELRKGLCRIYFRDLLNQLSSVRSFEEDRAHGCDRGSRVWL